MSQIAKKEGLIDIQSDIRVISDPNIEIISVQKSHLYDQKCQSLFPDCDLDFLLENLDLKTVCKVSIEHNGFSDNSVKSLRVKISNLAFILRIHTCKLDKDLFQIDIDFSPETDLIDLSDNVNQQWSRIKWAAEILERSNEAVVLLDAKSGSILYINPAALKLVNMSSQELKGAHFSMMYDNNFNKDYESNREELFEKGSATYHNIKLKNHASIVQDATVNAEVIQLGKFKYVYTVIHEKRIIEDHLKVTEYNHFKALFDDSLMGFALVDFRGNIFNINNSFSDFTGYSKDEVHSFKFKDLAYELFDKRTSDRIMDSFQRFSKISNEEILMLTRESEWLWCRLSCSTIHDENGKALFFILNLENIHDAKGIKLKYDANQNLLSALSSNLNECIYRSSLDDGIIFTNDAFVKKFGYEDFSEIENVNPAIFYADEKYREEIIDEINKNEKIIGKEVYFKRKDRSRFWGLLNCSLYVDDNGKKFLDGVITDISRQKETEKLLKQNNIELKKINSEMDKFVYSVTHDLRAPLMSLLGLIKISKDEVKESELMQYLEMMETSVFKLDNFINDIIDFSRNARTEIDKKEIDFDKLINEVWHNLEYISESHKIKFNFSKDLDNVFLGDYKRLSIILSNLLSNAIRYSNHSGYDSRISVNVVREDECLKLTVEDNGPGIPEKYQEKVFEMFFRANDSKNGSGLGLYIVKETVEKLRGAIKLKSNPISGTRFEIFLPF